MQEVYYHVTHINNYFDENQNYKFAEESESGTIKTKEDFLKALERTSTAPEYIKKLITQSTSLAFMHLKPNFDKKNISSFSQKYEEVFGINPLEAILSPDHPGFKDLNSLLTQDASLKLFNDLIQASENKNLKSLLDYFKKLNGKSLKEVLLTPQHPLFETLNNDIAFSLVYPQVPVENVFCTFDNLQDRDGLNDVVESLKNIIHKSNGSFVILSGVKGNGKSHLLFSCLKETLSKKPFLFFNEPFINLWNENENFGMIEGKSFSATDLTCQTVYFDDLNNPQKTNASQMLKSLIRTLHNKQSGTVFISTNNTQWQENFLSYVKYWDEKNYEQIEERLSLFVKQFTFSGQSWRQLTNPNAQKNVTLSLSNQISDKEKKEKPQSMNTQPSSSQKAEVRLSQEDRGQKIEHFVTQLDQLGALSPQEYAVIQAKLFEMFQKGLSAKK